MPAVLYKAMDNNHSSPPPSFNHLLLQSDHTSNRIEMEGPIGFLFPYTVLNWVITMLHKLPPRLLPFWQPSVGFLNPPSYMVSEEQCAKKSKRGELGLSREEVQIVMRRMGMECEQLKDWIGTEEIYDMFAEEEPSLQEVKAAFSLFDEGSDGFIDAVDLQRALFKLGFSEGKALEGCEDMIAVYDANKDGRIDFNEFVKLMERSFC